MSNDTFTNGTTTAAAPPDELLVQVITYLTYLLIIVKVITLPLYTVFLSVLVIYRKDPQMNHPFFKLIFSHGIADMGSMISQLLFNTIPQLGWMTYTFMHMNGWASRIYNATVYFTCFAQMFGMLAVGINRLTAYVFPMSHARIWSYGRLTTIIVILQWSLAFLSITPMLWYFDFKEVEWPKGSVLMQWADKGQSIMYGLIMGGLIDGGIAVAMLVVYVIIFCTAVIRTRNYRAGLSNGGSASVAAERTAFKMAMVGFVSTIGEFIAAGVVALRLGAYQFFDHYAVFKNEQLFWLINNIGVTLMSSATPYSMLVFSSVVRARFFGLFGVKRALQRRQTKKDEEMDMKHKTVTVTAMRTSSIQVHPAPVKY